MNSVTAITDEHVISDNGRELQLARTSSILSYMILAGGLATIGVAAYLVVVSYSSLPYWDGWIQIKYAAERPQPGVLDWLWSQYNEQRLLIPKLFLLTDLLWFGARQKFLLASVFTIQLLYLLALTWSMRVLGDWRGAMLRTGIGLAAFCLFCPSQWENLGWGMQTCYVLPGLFATLSFIGLHLLDAFPDKVSRTLHRCNIGGFVHPLQWQPAVAITGDSGPSASIGTRSGS